MENEKEHKDFNQKRAEEMTIIFSNKGGGIDSGTEEC